MSALKKIILINLSLFLLALIAIVWIIVHELHQPFLQVDLIQVSVLKRIILVDNWLPRFTMALLVGGALGISTIILQQVTYNPLASDSTLAVSSGAYIALLGTHLFIPSLLLWLSSAMIAFFGGLASLLLVFMMSYRNQFLPIRMLLSGLILNLYLGALATALVIFHPEAAKNIFAWQAGSLIQDSWHDVKQIVIVSLIAFSILILLLRAFEVMQLGETQAKSLGVPVVVLRVVCILFVAYLCATTLSLVGMIGFIGLAAATMINQLQLTKAWHKLLFSYTTAGLILLLTDCLLVIIQFYCSFYLPVGTVSAFIGTPLLLYLIFKALPTTISISSNNSLTRCDLLTPIKTRGHWILAILIILILLWSSLTISNTQYGFISTGWNHSLINIKLPRIITAISAGIMLSTCGVLLQCMTHNSLASPDLLGISSGAAIAIIVTVMTMGSDIMPLWLPGLLGALLTFLFIIAINIKNKFQPEKVVLTGIAFAAFLTALIQLFLVTGDPRIQYLLIWLSGSTYSSGLLSSVVIFLVALFILFILLIFSRSISLLELPENMSNALGMNSNIVRFLLIVVSTILITLATLQIGPLSFIGLLAPLMTRIIGFHFIRNQLLMSSLIGSILMIAADWLGRNIMFPYEIPTGVMASLIGGSCFIYLIRRS